MIAPSMCDDAQDGQSVRLVLDDGATREFALNERELLPIRTAVALSLQTVRTKTAKLTSDKKHQGW